MAFLEPGDIVDHGCRSGLDASVIAVDRLVPADGGVLEVPGFLLGDEHVDVVAQASLVAFEGENVVGFLVDDGPGDVALASHGVDGDDGALDRHHLQKLRDRDDFVRFLRHFHLPEDQPLARREGRDHVNRRFRSFLVAGPPRRLAVDGDHLGRSPGLGRNPGDEAALEFLSIQRREDVAQMVVGGCPVAKRPEPPQQLQLLRPETGDIGEGFRPGQHRQKAKQQNLVERIHHLAGLPRVRNIAEILQKNNALANRPVHLHRDLPCPIRGHPSIQNFHLPVTNSFTRLPWLKSAIGLRLSEWMTWR